MKCPGKDIFKLKHIFVPFNIENVHWALAVIYMEDNLALAAPVCGRRIGTQSVKILLVRMCLCLVGTHKSMFSCMNLSVFYWCVL